MALPYKKYDSVILEKEMSLVLFYYKPLASHIMTLPHKKAEKCDCARLEKEVLAFPTEKIPCIELRAFTGFMHSELDCHD